jgi:hypothetical protein
MTTAERKEAHPLFWPEGWTRTRIQDRKPQSQWKKNANEYREALIKEFERMGVTQLVISSNIPLNMRGDLSLGIQPLDPGVAVYFSRPQKEDYGWQEVLGINDPAPSVELIESKYRELARKYHPDTGGDVEMFKIVGQAKRNALDYINRRSGSTYQYVIACDAFKEVRMNLNAIRLTIAAIRQIERCGTSSLLERAFKGFQALAEHVPAGSGIAG